MKVTLFLTFVCAFQLMASTGKAQNAVVRLSSNTVTVEKLFAEIEQQTDYLMAFRDKELDPNATVTLKEKEGKVNDILDEVLEGTGLGYDYTNNYIVISKNVEDSKAVQQKGKKISGVVKDMTGEPIIGANVLIQGQARGVITDIDGRFTLDVPANAVLHISYVGYIAKDVPVGNQSNIEVVLGEDTESLEEVVVIGYGTARKGDLTGPISSVRGKNLSERSVTQLSTALQGQMSGVQVTRSSGEPGAGATIRVRGVTTMSTNDPLVIIDGIPGSLNDVIATDVETMSVLKDAAAAAIYGSRAAAGVILITTKRAQQGKFQMDYTYEYSIDTPTAKPGVGSTVDWMNIQNEVKWNDGASDPYSQYSQETINNWMANNAKDPYHYPNESWVDLLLKKTTSHQQHNFNVSGGTDKLRTKFSMNYQNADGYYKNKSYERFAGRLNNDWKINNWIHANVDIDFSASTSISPSSSSPIANAYITPPYYNAYWEDGRYADVKDGGNDLAALNEGGTSNTKYYKFGGKAQLDLTPVKGLTLTAVFAPRYTFTKGKSHVKKVEVYYENNTPVTLSSNRNTSLSESRNDTRSMTYQFFANYQNKWGDHSFSAMAGYEGYEYKWENLGASRNYYTLTNFPYLNLGPEDYQYNSGSAGHNAYSSIFGRLMYSYKNRYLLQANVRQDASSRFAPGYRTGTFPSVSAGWVATEESWFPKSDVLNYLKLRGSIGSLGNERIGSEFPYQAAISFGNSYMYDKSTGSVTAVQNAAQVYYAFRDITWETTTTYDIGVDFQMFNNRLSVTADWYYKKTEDMLLEVGFPSYAGFSAPQQNAGDMHTKGWDFEASWRDNVGDFDYGISFNLSDYRSVMGYLGDKRTISGNYILEEGSYYNEWFMYKTDGLFYTDEDLIDPNTGKKYPTLTNNDKAGNIKYVDVNEDGVINADDKVRLGNSLPEFQFGGNLFLGWKDFDFSLSFQGVGHQNVLFNSRWIEVLRGQYGSIPTLVLGNYWSQHNTEEQNRAAKYPRLTFSNQTNSFTGSDYWLFNGAYLRVKNITLGYNLPKNWLKKFYCQGLRIYATITDLPAISNYPKGWDPERGVDADFISTSFSFGANIKF